MPPFQSVLLLGVLGVSVASGGAPASEPTGDSRVHMRLESQEEALGRPDAPLTMVEFTDYQCPFCRAFQAKTWPRLKREYVDTGKLRFIVRDLPLPLHSAAQPAAEAAHCAGEQGKFWPMHAALLGGEADLGSDGIGRRAQALGLDMEPFKACVADQRYARQILSNAAEADALALRGTPSFVIGRTVQGELNGIRLEGALPYEDFKVVLQEALARP